MAGRHQTTVTTASSGSPDTGNTTAKGGRRRRRRTVGIASLLLALTAALGQFGPMSATPAQAYNLFGWRWNPRSQAISWEYACEASWAPVQCPTNPASAGAGWSWWTSKTQDAAQRWANAISADRVFFYHRQTGQDPAGIVISWYIDANDASGHGGCSATTNGFCNPEAGFAKINYASQYYTLGVSNVFNTYQIMHELGHGLGLDHSCAKGAIMQGPAGPCPGGPYACTPPGANSDSPTCPVTPTADDITAVGAQYPSGTGGPGWYANCNPICYQLATRPKS